MFFPVIRYTTQLYERLAEALSEGLHISQFDQGEAGAAESKLRWNKLHKNFWSGSLASKITLEKQYFIHSEPEGEVGHLYFQIQMGVACSIFEPHPPNFENLHNF